MFRKVIFFFCLSALLVFSLSAQSNEFLDELLASEEVNMGQASYLALVASDNIGEDADEARAFDLLLSLGWAPAGAEQDSSISISQFSYILMKAFGVKGGIMYSLFPSPRYAYREMKSRLVIQGRTDPDDKLDAFNAVRMLGRIFDLKGVQL